MTHRYKNRPQDEQVPQSGKVANDRNKTGDQHPSQKNEGNRTARSRHDRLSQAGGTNQTKVRRGTTQGDSMGPQGMKGPRT